MRAVSILISILLMPSFAAGQTTRSAASRLFGDKAAYEELKVFEDQRHELETLHKQAREEYNRARSLIKTDKELRSDPQLYSNVRAQLYVSYYQNLDLAHQKVLLPHQQERLGQLARWSTLNRQSFGAVLQLPEVRELLEIDSPQATKLSEKEKELQEEFQKDLQELKDKYRKKLLDSLSKDQQKKFKEMLGERSNLHLRPAQF